jgi:hypothetical protein
MISIKKLAIVGAIGITYGLLFQFNIFMFSPLPYSTSIVWIFLPSGLALIFILLFDGSGAVGIALASTLVSYIQNFNNDLLLLLGSGLISGFSPWIAKMICIDMKLLRPNLKQLTPQCLSKAAVLFAILSSTLQQIFFTWQEGGAENFIKHLLLRAVGYLIGTFIVLYVAKFMMKALQILVIAKR